MSNGLENKAMKCAFSKKCGGCKYTGMTYGEQLDKKRNYLTKLLKDYTDSPDIIGMDNPYHYRNKVNAAFKRLRNGEIISGVYEEGSHRVIDITSCHIENEKADEIINTIKGLLKSFKITVYNEDSGYGLLRHVMVRCGHMTGEIMVVLVTAGPIFPSKKNFAKALVSRHPEITTIIQNINDKPTSMVLGARNQTIYGKGYIDDILCGKTFRISPTSFYQVNSVQTEVLYGKAIEFAKLTGNETVLDAYCGIGTIGIVASDRAGKVIGVELNKDAVRDAGINAKINNVKNISFCNNDAGKFMTGFNNHEVDVVFMDPPRSGSTPQFINSVLNLAPSRVVYISCGPDTLARDLKLFVKSGRYKVDKVVGVDMFPWTEHCEVICSLIK